MKLAQLSLTSSSIEGRKGQGTTDSGSDSDSDSDLDTFPATTAASTDADDDDYSSKPTKSRKSSSGSISGVQRLLQTHGPFKTSCIIPTAPRLNLDDPGKVEKPVYRPHHQVDTDEDDKELQSDGGMDRHPTSRRQSFTPIDRTTRATNETSIGPLDNVTTTSSTTPSRRHSQEYIEVQYNRNCTSKRYPLVSSIDHVRIHPWNLSSIAHTDEGNVCRHSSGDDDSDNSSMDDNPSDRKSRSFLRLHHQVLPPTLRRSSYSFGSRDHLDRNQSQEFVKNRRHSSSSILCVNPVNTISPNRRPSVQQRRGRFDNEGSVSFTPATFPPTRSITSSKSSPTTFIRRQPLTMTSMTAITSSSAPGSGARISAVSSRTSTPAFVYSYASATSSTRTSPAASRRSSTSTLHSPQTFVLQGFLAQHSNGHQLYRRPSRKCGPECIVSLGGLGQDSSSSCCYSSTECERDGDDEGEDEDEDDEDDEDDEYEQDERFLMLAQSPNSSEFDLRDFVDRELEQKAKRHQADSPVFFHGFPLLRMTPMDR
ncbi:hypothetical protein EMPS_06280 [Entomortierella parvispora]|uniref:Uncharacterized protein n=1 Tax=Entomortierella parvispora TaxID=205924 RepID=A0A9P3HCN2_9FUNG|nr:hypothetical protein EMPS_06280 [Entomortierella parvispora]